MKYIDSKTVVFEDQYFDVKHQGKLNIVLGRSLPLIQRKIWVVFTNNEFLFVFINELDFHGTNCIQYSLQACKAHFLTHAVRAAFMTLFWVRSNGA